MSPLSATEEWMNLVVIRDVEFVTSANSIYHCLKWVSPASKFTQKKQQQEQSQGSKGQGMETQEL